MAGLEGFAWLFFRVFSILRTIWVGPDYMRPASSRWHESVTRVKNIMASAAYHLARVSDSCQKHHFNQKRSWIPSIVILAILITTAGWNPALHISDGWKPFLSGLPTQDCKTFFPSILPNPPNYIRTSPHAYFLNRIYGGGEDHYW